MKYIHLIRPVGIWGTTLHAELSVTNDNEVKLYGYVVGFTGANFRLGGQSLGFGVSAHKFWHSIEDVPVAASEAEDQRALAVHASYRVIHLLILNEVQKVTIGRVYFPSLEVIEGKIAQP